MSDAPPTIHASAVLVGARAVLIRGAPGSGKSRLALDLLQAAESGAVRFARLVGDDRIHVEARSGRLLVRPAAALAGHLEIRGFGIRRLAHEPIAVVGLIVDLATPGDRLPETKELQASLAGIVLPRLAVPAGTAPMPAVLAFLGYPASRN